ncbi:MAG: DsbA family protein [Anaerolineales bacterium]
MPRRCESYWLSSAEGQDIRRWRVLHAAAAEAGLDADALQQAVETGRYTSTVDRHKTTAVEMGATGVPLFIFDEEYVVLGLQPYAAFQVVMELLVQEHLEE